MDNKISLKKCREVLKETGENLNDEQVLAIRDYLYDLAQIDIEIFRSIERREKEETQRDAERDK